MVVIAYINPLRYGFFHITHISHDPISLVSFSNSSTVFNRHSSYSVAFCGDGECHPSTAAEWVTWRTLYYRFGIRQDREREVLTTIIFSRHIFTQISLKYL